MKRVDLNVDIGEGFEFDEDLLMFATSANICCGAHTGSWEVTQRTIGLALDRDIRIGLHPGYPDRENMGRLSMKPDQRAEFEDSLRRQVDQFFNFVPASYLKPHGAFYGDSQDGLHSSAAILASICEYYRLPILGMPGTAHEGLGIGFISEGFADRGYTAVGRLIDRREPGAILHDIAAIKAQSVRLAEKIDSICIHGDTPGCVEIAESVYSALLDAGFEVGA